MAGGFANASPVDMLNAFTNYDTARYNIAAAQEKRREEYLDRQAQDMATVSEMWKQQYADEETGLDAELSNDPDALIAVPVPSVTDAAGNVVSGGGYTTRHYSEMEDNDKLKARKRAFMKRHAEVISGVATNVLNNNEYGKKMSTELLGPDRRLEGFEYNPRNDKWGTRVYNKRLKRSGLWDGTEEGVDTSKNPDTPSVLMSSDEMFDNITRLGEIALSDRGRQTARFNELVGANTIAAANRSAEENRQEALRGLPSAMSSAANLVNATTKDVLYAGPPLAGLSGAQTAPASSPTIAVTGGAETTATASPTTATPAVNMNVQVILDRFAAEGNKSKALADLDKLKGIVVPAEIEAAKRQLDVPKVAGKVYERVSPEETERRAAERLRALKKERYMASKRYVRSAGEAPSTPFDAEIADLDDAIKGAGGVVRDNAWYQFGNNGQKYLDRFLRSVDRLKITREEIAAGIKDETLRNTVLLAYDERKAVGNTSTPSTAAGVRFTDNMPPEDRDMLNGLGASLAAGGYRTPAGEIDMTALLGALPSGVLSFTRGIETNDLRKVAEYAINKSFDAKKIREMTPREQRLFGALSVMGTEGQQKAFGAAFEQGNAETAAAGKFGADAYAAAMGAQPLNVDSSFATAKVNAATQALQEQEANKRTALSARVSLAGTRKEAEDKFMTLRDQEAKAMFQSGDAEKDEPRRQLFTKGMNTALGVFKQWGIPIDNQSNFAAASTAVSDFTRKIHAANPTADVSKFDASAAVYAAFPRRVFDPAWFKRGVQAEFPQALRNDPQLAAMAASQGKEAAYKYWAKQLEVAEMNAQLEANGVEVE